MKYILADFGLVTVGDEQAWAVISPDDRYRYILGRLWDFNLPWWVFCMINPSKARGAVTEAGVRKVINDPTIRKCIGFAERGGAGGILVVNALTYSATDPKDVVRAWRAGVDVKGEHNAEAIRWALSHSTDGRRIAAWGKIPPQLQEPARSARAQFKIFEPDCFGLNLDGTPKHPLMLGYDTPLVRMAS